MEAAGAWVIQADGTGKWIWTLSLWINHPALAYLRDEKTNGPFQRPEARHIGFTEKRQIDLLCHGELVYCGFVGTTPGKFAGKPFFDTAPGLP